MSTEKHERIRQRAHAIWENEGRPDGEHERHWAMATSEIDAEDASPPIEATTGAGPALAAHTKDAKPRKAPVRRKKVTP
jgi:hypothetical protein